ncbi:MAG: MFS transporter [Candidatus Eisenbacteria bacterium]|uniref:MFS transporter n=1 Tax=Eiseniibacteriota bacterium TaxID=2212470 RepID=A0A9D6L9E3_UNCEI|nr:MFS transporter [Candidatus Eisenbacteria bacterium]MBI3540045.1 MFS transporter [Candidatus Eisenbacteria bacterium]
MNAVPGAAPRWRVVPVLALGTLMATLDLSIVNIALPTLARDFAVPLTTIAWVVLAYVLTITGLLLAFGRLADRVGRRRVYGLGLAVFTIASLACAASPGAGALIAARALQGIGAAMMTANSTALLAASFPGAERGRALGVFGAVVGVGLGLGPPLGGLLVAHLSWRWIFLVNLPLGTLALAMLGRVPADPPRRGVPSPRVAATAAWCAGLALLMFALSRGPEAAWRPAVVVPPVVAAIALLAAFVAIERRSTDPLLPLAALAGPLGRAATLTLLGNMISIAVGLHLPLYLEGVLGFDAGRSGRWIAIIPLAALVIAPAAGRRADRRGSKPLTIAGLAITAAGLVVLAGLGAAPGFPRLVLGMALVGVGQGLFAAPNARAILGAVGEHDLGLASGLQATMRNLGFAAGAALGAALLASRFAAHGGGTLTGHMAAAGRNAFAAATADTYLALAGLALVATAVAAAGRAPTGMGRNGPD